jgi:hypothetical protein
MAWSCTVISTAPLIPHTPCPLITHACRQPPHRTYPLVLYALVLTCPLYPTPRNDKTTTPTTPTTPTTTTTTTTTTTPTTTTTSLLPPTATHCHPEILASTPVPQGSSQCLVAQGYSSTNNAPPQFNVVCTAKTTGSFKGPSHTHTRFAPQACSWSR